MFDWLLLQGPDTLQMVVILCKNYSCLYEKLFLLFLFSLKAYAKFSGAPLKVHKITNPWRSPTGEFTNAVQKTKFINTSS